MACLGAIEHLGWPLTRIVTADVWATDIIPADLPEMAAWKAKADTIIKERWGITVEHVRAKYTYQDCFYMTVGANGRKSHSSRAGQIYGWPYQRGPWCNSRLKVNTLSQLGSGDIHYLGIAADEPSRIRKQKNNPNVRLPLVELGWEEDCCGLWAKYSDLLSPSYTTEARGGCWFCHNQGVEQLRRVRHNYPELWSLMLKWDKDSSVSFKADGHSVCDYDQRFAMEDNGKIDPNKRFRWSLVQENG